MATIKLRRGNKASLPTTGLAAGEPLVTTDRGTLHIATSATTTIPVVPPIEDLPVMAPIDGATDLLIMHDVSETTGQKEKKITFNTFKTALNIPPASTDEKVAVAAGGVAGYLWNTTGNDGVLRVGPGLSFVKDASNAFATINLVEVDGGTF